MNHEMHQSSLKFTLKTYILLLFVGKGMSSSTDVLKLESKLRTQDVFADLLRFVMSQTNEK